MAGIHPAPGTDGTDGAEASAAGARRRRKAVRYAVPVAVAGVAAATIGIGSALASTGDPDLPKISAQDLIAKMAASDTQRMSGTVKISTDLGLPSLPGGASLGDLGGKSAGGKGGGDASPQARLTELAAGTHTLRIAVDGPDKQRLSIVESAAEYSVVHNAGEVWAYDSASNTAYHAKAPQDARKPGHKAPSDAAAVSPQELARKVLAAADGTTAITVDGTAKVAGRDTYQLAVKPKQGDSTVEAVRIAVDAKTGVPLKFTLAPKGGGKAVVDAAFTKVDFGAPAAGTFAFTPPKGAKVTEGDAKDAAGRHDKALPELPGMPDLGGTEGAEGGRSTVLGKGWGSIVRIDAGKDAATQAKAAQAKKDAGKNGKNGEDAQALLDSFGTKVSGDFGTGRLFSTRIVNVLMTDDGKVYAGAVTKDALVKAASTTK
ncbi:DUF2092 domain-containing protein [Streptomyces luteosporeus]|uniref:Outer membrane lipoprotein carrier protein LolA n=1 Tax=Streptomyces luteosporeus TaxID=173856 RepID=A0ABN3TPY1_9ACTN